MAGGDPVLLLLVAWNRSARDDRILLVKRLQPRTLARQNIRGQPHQARLQKIYYGKKEAAIF